MRGTSRIIVGAIAALWLSLPLAGRADDGKAAFEHRVDTMKRMGHALYVTIGRVVRGKDELGPQTADAAETIVSLSATIDGLFPPGSDVGNSRVKPEIFAAAPRVKDLAAGVQGAAAQLAAAAKARDEAGLAANAKALNEACETCHNQFRKPVE